LVDIRFESVSNSQGNTTYNVVGSQANGDNLPLIEVEISEYDSPCMYHAEKNAYPDKETFVLYPPEYYKGCVSAISGNYTSPLHRQVEGFPNVSEYRILQENYGLMNIISTFPDYNVTKLNTYQNSLY
jgi:hypothetical protein